MIAVENQDIKKKLKHQTSIIILVQRKHQKKYVIFIIYILHIMKKYV